MKSSDTQMELVRRYLGGEATLEEARRLESMLAVDAQLRRDYLAYARIEAGLSSKVRPKLVKTAPPNRWLSWRPLAAAAAGLVIGAFSATMVWAVSAVKGGQVHARELPLADPSFEHATAIPHSPVSRMNVWHGDPAEVVGKTGRVSPRSGEKMLRFLASAIRADQIERSTAADMWQVVEVPAGGAYRARVRAWFAADAGRDASFTIMAAAVDCEASELQSVWDKRFDADPRVLSAGNKNMTVRASDTSWKLCELTLDVPTGTRLLVIDVAAGKLRGVPEAQAFPAQFVDDVSVSLVNDEPLP